MIEKLTKSNFQNLVNLQAVQKFVHVCLQRMCHRLHGNQAYFGRRSSRVRVALPASDGQEGASGRIASAPQLWMDTILEQLEDALGPAVTLARLLGSNEELLAKYATPKLVTRFSDMVRLLGPQYVTVHSSLLITNI